MMPWVLNTAWLASCLPEGAAFGRATRGVRAAQEQVLAEIVRANRDTVFGRRHGFAGVGSPREFQERVPLAVYGDYAAAIGQIGQGAVNVLTRQRVELLEPTSGTTGGEKLIPFTRGLRAQFQRAVAAWMADLLWHRPALRKGRAYWSISPGAAAARRTTGGIPIGFEDDAAYLGRASRWVLRRVLAVPAEVAQVRDMEAFRYRTLRALLAAEDLTLISIWSPTFLLALLAPLEGWAERLCGDLEPRRARVLRTVFAAPGSLAEKLARIWPRLGLISCWADAGAARYVPAVRALFPQVELQPKGLLATEGCVSFPLVGQPAPVLAARSHFFEFQEADAPDRVGLADELDVGGRYRVVLTTAGGLYRYQLCDEVEIVGRLEACPLLRFVGKADGTSDLVGEKLAEPHVRAVLDAMMQSRGLVPRFALLVPVPQPPHYRLYLQDPHLSPQHVPALEGDLESGLAQNPHYAYARQLGQLGAVRIVLLDPAGEPGWAIYERACLQRGQRAGNIKPVALDRRPGWPEAFGDTAWAPETPPLESKAVQSP